MTMQRTRAARRTTARRARGVVMLVTLVVMVVMLISAVALMRSFDTTLTSAGNLAFKRDLAQQSEAATEEVLAQFRLDTGFRSALARASTDKSKNYSSELLPTNAQGIPTVLLLSNTDFESQGYKGDKSFGRGIRLRHVIDRLCTVGSNGKQDNALGLADCTRATAFVPTGGSSSAPRRGEIGTSDVASAVPQPVIYRITIRATGPRDTQSFFQTTFSCCDN